MVRGWNRGGTGSGSVTVHGGSLGLVAYTSMVRSGATGCEGTEWESETSVRCLTGRGTRGTRRVVMTAGSRLGSLSSTISFDGSVFYGVARKHRAACDIVRSQGSRCSVVFSSLPPSSLWLVSADVIGAINTSSSDQDRGCGPMHRIANSLTRVLGSNDTSITVSLDAEEIDWACCSCNGDRLIGQVTITQVDPYLSANRAGTGSASVTVRGANLGLVAYTSMVRSGATGCEGTEWESETSVRCRRGTGPGARGGW